MHLLLKDLIKDTLRIFYEGKVRKGRKGRKKERREKEKGPAPGGNRNPLPQ